MVLTVAPPVDPNIVQYRGFVKTSDFLYIILEQGLRFAMLVS